MKKGWKVLIIITSVCAVLGIVLAGIGIGMGGGRTFTKWAREGEFSFGVSTPLVHLNEVELRDEYEVITGEGNRIAVASDETISGMELEVEGACVSIVRSDTDELRIGYENARELQFFVEDGKLCVMQRNDILFLNEVVELTIYVPERLELDTVSLAMGGGKIEADLLAARNVDITLGAGELILREATADVANIEIGAGSAEIRSGQFGDLYVEVGMGSFDYTGSVRGSITAECSMGSIDFLLDGDQMDYNYDIDCAMGSIEVDHREYAGIAAEKHIDNDAAWNCSLECAMGGITLRFR